MTVNELLTLGGQFGSSAIFVWYLLAQQKRADLLTEKRIEADVKVAEAMIALTMAVENLRRVP